MPRNDVKLMDRDEIKRRFARMTGPPGVKRPTELTRFDVAKWFGIDERTVRAHANGKEDINDFWQLAYSEFFALVDAGCIKIEFNNYGKKTLSRVPPPKATVKKTPRPYVDLTTMRLGFDQ